MRWLLTNKTLTIVALVISFAVLIDYISRRICITPPQQATVTMAPMIEGARPVADLGNGWWLVEVTQRYECENPLPLGQPTVVLIIPHLVRMTWSELEHLTNENTN